MGGFTDEEDRDTRYHEAAHAVFLYMREGATLGDIWGGAGDAPDGPPGGAVGWTGPASGGRGQGSGYVAMLLAGEYAVHVLRGTPTLPTLDELLADEAALEYEDEQEAGGDKWKAIRVLRADPAVVLGIHALERAYEDACWEVEHWTRELWPAIVAVAEALACAPLTGSEAEAIIDAHAA